jgi:hypothetical protein
MEAFGAECEPGYVMKQINRLGLLTLVSLLSRLGAQASETPKLADCREAVAAESYIVTTLVVSVDPRLSHDENSGGKMDPVSLESGGGASALQGKDCTGQLRGARRGLVKQHSPVYPAFPPVVRLRPISTL